MISKKVVVKNPTGLHLYPAGVLCKEASKYKSHIEIIFENTTSNAKSVLSILGACIKMGDEVVVTVNGDDEIEAMDKIIKILENEIE